MTRASINSIRTISPQLSGSIEGKSGQEEGRKPEAKAPAPPGITSVQLPEVGEIQVTENEKPLAPAIINRSKKRSRFLAIVQSIFVKRELTKEEQILLTEKAKRREMEKVLRMDAINFQDRIRNKLNQLGLCYRYRKSDRDFIISGVQQVQFEIVVMNPDAIFFKINTLKLPRGIFIKQLMDEAVLTDLSIACMHKVNGQWSEKCGAWFIVERASGVLGIPRHVMFQDMIERFPSSADGLSIPIGMTVNGKPIYRSLAQMYSLLIGGTIGSGKSNIMNVIICSLIQRNRSDRLKFLMIDLKGGLEFNFYEGIPHLLKLETKDEDGNLVAPNGICYKNNQVPRALEWLHGEGERRIGIIRESGYKEIGRYNQHNRKMALPHIILVIDEWADVKLMKKLGAEAEELLINIAQRFRAVGIHVILCTQVPKAEVVSTRIKGVLPAKLAFSCPTNQASMVIIDNAGAKGLEPAGRCILQWNSEMAIQTPYINDEIIHEIVEAAKGGKFTPVVVKKHDVTQLEIQEWALNNDNGNLSFSRLFAAFKTRGLTAAELTQWLQEWEKQEIMISSSIYKVEAGAGNRPRRMVALDNQETLKEEKPN